MNKKIINILTLSLLIPTLTSCFYLEDIIQKTTDTTINKTATDFTSYNVPTYTSDYKTENLNKDNIGLGMGYRYLPSTGDSKILVIPIQTKDYTFTSTQLSLIEKGFFGSSDETGWESVSSYYSKSSYGQLNITGEVTSPVTLAYTASELERNNSSYEKQNITYTDIILNGALKALTQSDSTLDLSEYDTNSDGYIDAVWMVYAVPYNSSSSFYWAYTTWSSQESTFSNKKPCCYAWASVDFLTAGGYYTGSIFNKQTVADSHTFIHETGHMLGLDDYYSYDYSTEDNNYDSPVGGVDMMDFNIGDHCSFSKFLLGWKTPTVVSEEYLKANDYKLTLRSLTDYGDSLLIPVTGDKSTAYNNTPYDEYLLVEYYTPTNLNFLDSKTLYTNNLSTYSQTGVLIYHINASVGKIVPKTSTEVMFNGEVYDKLPSYSSDWGYKYLYTTLYSNTRSYCLDDSISDEGMSYYRGRLISLLPATGRRINGNKTGFSTNSVLYTKGDTFYGKNGIYSEFLFDDGSSVDYSFTVKSTSSSSCTLSFTVL